MSLEGVESLCFAGCLDRAPQPAMLAVFKVDVWDNHGLLLIDSALIHSVVDMLIGGRRGTTAMREATAEV